MIRVSAKQAGGGALRRLLKTIKSTQYSVTLGFYSTAKYGPEHGGISVPEVARINNFGAVTQRGLIPPRPFLTTMPYTHGKQWKLLFNKVTSTHVDLLNYKASLRDALEIVAQQMQGDLQLNIIQWVDPPNSPVTIKKKGSENPLVDTGFLVASASYQLKIK